MSKELFHIVIILIFVSMKTDEGENPPLKQHLNSNPRKSILPDQLFFHMGTNGGKELTTVFNNHIITSLTQTWKYIIKRKS